MAKSPPKRRVRLVDIAKMAEVDKSTVSLALRGDPRIKEATRERVLATAKELGYAPDPHLSQLMGYLRSTDGKQQGECIGYLMLTPPGVSDLEETPFFRKYHDGAKAEIEQIGYRVDIFRLRDYSFNTRRLSEVLHHRGIQGLIVSPPVGMEELDKFDWSHFAAITMGYRLRSPALNRVVCDQIVIIRMVLGQLVARGYKRPLLAHRTGRDLHVKHRWSIAFDGTSSIFKTLEARHVYSGDPDDNFVNAVKETQADCVIGLSHVFGEALKKAGYNFPHDLGYVLLDKYDGPEGVCSVDQQPYLLGQMAARQLSGFLDRHEIGVPETPFTMTIRPSWCEGSTLRPTHVDG